MFLMISLSCFGQKKMTFLKNWKSYPVPTNADTLYKYGFAKNDWFVYFDGNNIRADRAGNYENSRVKLPFEITQSNSDVINIAAPLAGLIDTVAVEDGYLAGFNRGEWGGELYWFSKNGEKRYKISDDQIVQFIRRDNKIYAIAGLSHLGLTIGNIIEIEKNGRKWIAKEYLKLPSAPDAVQLDSKGNFIIVTDRGSFSKDGNFSEIPPSLFSIDRDANIDTLVKAGMWGGLYPSSMVIQNDVVYIGMRKGVYKFDLATKKDEWLLPE